MLCYPKNVIWSGSFASEERSAEYFKKIPSGQFTKISIFTYKSRVKCRVPPINLNTDSMKTGKVHNVWSSLESTVLDMCKRIVKCRLLTGTYLFQSNRHKFSQSVVSADRCCGMEDEDLAHMLLYCLLLANQRGQSYSKIKSMVISQIGEYQWKRIFDTPEKIIKLILDCV